MTRFALFFATLLCLPLSFAQSQELAQPAQKQTPAKIRIGVYDSRAIAVAWAGSKFNPVAETMKEFKAAQDAHDEKKIAELEAWGKNHQRLLHFQGFGRVPVGELLTPVRQPMKQLMADQNLAAITMQCDDVSDQVELVDVTVDLVKLYDPSAQTLEWVKQMRDKEPLSLLELADLPANQ